MLNGISARKWVDGRVPLDPVVIWLRLLGLGSLVLLTRLDAMRCSWVAGDLVTSWIGSCGQRNLFIMVYYLCNGRCLMNGYYIGPHLLVGCLLGVLFPV